jgi:voltage-gated potassium channel
MISLVITIWRFLKSLSNGLKEPEFRGLFFFVIILLVTGTIFYSQVEHWKLLDALYFSVTTLTTVGSSMEPHTNLGKIFTIIYIFVGLGSVAGLITSLARHSRDQHPDIDKLSEQLTRKR